MPLALLKVFLDRSNFYEKFYEKKNCFFKTLIFIYYGLIRSPQLEKPISTVSGIISSFPKIFTDFFFHFFLVFSEIVTRKVSSRNISQKMCKTDTGRCWHLGNFDHLWSVSGENYKTTLLLLRRNWVKETVAKIQVNKIQVKYNIKK